MNLGGRLFPTQIEAAHLWLFSSPPSLWALVKLKPAQLAGFFCCYGVASSSG